jgi:hypothetical protein
LIYARFARHTRDMADLAIPAPVVSSDHRLDDA